jgi:hypothetical protein
VPELRTQVDARPGADRGALVADVQHAPSVEHVDHLVVQVVVLGRALRGDVPDELSCAGQPGTGLEQYSKLAVARGVAGLLVRQPHRDRAVGGRGRRGRKQHRHERQLVRAGVLDLGGLARGHVRGGLRRDVVGHAVDHEPAVAAEHEQGLLALVGAAAKGPPGDHADDALLQGLGARVAIEGHPDDGRFAGVAARLDVVLGEGVARLRHGSYPRPRWSAPESMGPGLRMAAAVKIGADGVHLRAG